MPSKESMTWKTALIWMALIAQVPVGIGLFYRSRGIKDTAVIIAGVFFSVLARTFNKLCQTRKT